MIIEGGVGASLPTSMIILRCDHDRHTWLADFGESISRNPPAIMAGTGAVARIYRLARAGKAIYREAMGRLILIALAVIAVVMLVSVVLSALHFLFWIALLALIVTAVLRFSGGMRRSRR
jgi:hypothetical protein